MFITYIQGSIKMNFKEDKYVAVKDMISEDIVDIGTRYALIDEMTRFSDEASTADNNAQVPGSHSKYADPLMESILQHIHINMEYVTGLTLYPTYSYFRVYRPGMDLKPHTDRPACEISTTISFRYNYLGSEQQAWPIWVAGKNGPKPFSLEPGDAVVYRGCEIEHWREKLDAPDGSYHVQGFFHFVDANGPYADEKLDKRLFIGQQKSSDNPAVKTTFTGKNYISTIY